MKKVTFNNFNFIQIKKFPKKINIMIRPIVVLISKYLFNYDISFTFFEKEIKKLVEVVRKEHF